MAQFPNPPRKPEKPAPVPAPPEDVDAYELDAPSAAPAKPSAPKLNRSYLVETEPAAPGEKSKEPEPPPGQPKLVDPGELARKRDDARKRSAELWAQEVARKQKLLLIKVGLGVALAAGAAVYFLFIRG